MAQSFKVVKPTHKQKLVRCLEYQYLRVLETTSNMSLMLNVKGVGPL